MATRAEVKKWLDTIVEKLNDFGPAVASGWGGSVQFIFPDLKTGWMLKLKMDGTVESLVEKIDEKNANGVVETNSDTFIDIYEKRIAPTEARASGAMQCRKSLDALVKVLATTVD